MLPFPIISSRNVLTNKVLMDIDFTRQNIGDTFITDRIGNSFQKTGTGTSSVQSDPVLGNVMVFSGNSYFITPINDSIRLSTRHFRLTVQFKSTISTENMVFSTGDFYSSGSIIGGILLTLFNNTGTQLFATTSDGTFTRCNFSYNVNTWRNISFEWNPVTRIMSIKDNDTALLLASYNISAGFGDGTNFSIGASYVRGNIASYVGSLKKLIIEELK